MIGNSDLNKKILAAATKVELKAEKDKNMKFQGFNSSYFCSKNHLEDASTQNYLVFQPGLKYFCKKSSNTDNI